MTAWSTAPTTSVPAHGTAVSLWAGSQRLQETTGSAAQFHAVRFSKEWQPSRNIPHIIWGSGGGFLKQGQVLDAVSTKNNRLLNTLLSAVLQDTHTTVENFGEGTGGMLDLVRA